MRVPDDQVATEEVKRWRGVHLLHFAASSCSQKVRILLSEKAIAYESHPVDLARQQHTKPWFLGINPRGVVPVLVHDGAVHVESNDIMAALDALPSEAEPFFPRTDAEQADVTASLELEDSLHMDLRNLTMGFMAPRRLVAKSPKTLDAYEKGGRPDESRAKEVAWWRRFAEQGITREQATASFRAFAQAFEDLEKRLEGRPWLIGDRISVLEIAWFISIHRLVLAGYPIERHPRLAAHYAMLCERPAFAYESSRGLFASPAARAYGAFRRLTRSALMDVVSA